MTPQEEKFLKAAKNGNKNYVKMHLDNVNTTAQTAAFICTPSIEIGQLLLDGGIDVNACAIEVIDIAGRFQTVKEKKQYFSFWINMEDKFDIFEDSYVSYWTALGYACKHNELSKAKWLIEKGADKSKTSHLIRPNRFMPAIYDWSPQEIASVNGNLTLAELVCIDNTCHFTKQELFFDAVKNGYEEEVKNYLQQGININITNDDGQTPLMIAAKNGKDTIVDILLTAKADVSMYEEFTLQEQQFLQAANKGDAAYIAAHLKNASRDVKTAAFVLSPSVPVCALLLENGVDINSCIYERSGPHDEYWWSSLGRACRAKNIPKIEWLLSKGVNVESPSAWIHEFVHVDDKFGRRSTWKRRYFLTPLLDASTQGFMDIVMMLIKVGADINRQGSTKDGTPLMCAIEHGNMDIVKLLLASGADVNAQDNEGRTALMLAANHGQFEVVKNLVAAGADVHARGRSSKTAVDYAEEASLNKDVRRNIVEFLREHGAQSAKELKQTTVVQGFGFIAERKIIQAIAPDFGTDSPQNTTAPSLNRQLQRKFVHLCRWGKVSEAENLLSMGADVNEESLGEKPLQNAILGNNPNMVELLLKHGAAVTPYVLQLAENHHNEEIINLLKSAGAKE